MAPDLHSLLTFLVDLVLKFSSAVRSFLFRPKPPEVPKRAFIEGVTVRGGPHSQPLRGSMAADVYKGDHGNIVVCVKKIRFFEDDSTAAQLYSELEAKALEWRKLEHQNILRFYGIDKTTFDPMYALVMPWAEQTAPQWLASRRHEVPRVTLGVANGAAWLHSQDIVHGDIRGTNVFVSDEGQVLLADVGYASFYAKATARMTAPGGSSTKGRFNAPEQHYPSKFAMENFEYTKEADVFSFGMLCLELYTERPPFAEIANDATVYLAVVNGKRPQQPTGIPNEVWQIMTTCWQEDRANRPALSVVHSQLNSCYQQTNDATIPQE